MRKLLVVGYMMLLGVSTLWASPEYVSITPMDGDGILSILRRYHLLDSKCDREHFYEINKIKGSTSSIYTDRKYKLPILIYEYDGTSIRSTIGDNNWDKAVRIRDYNNLLYKEGVKPTAFNKGKNILWVPYRELYCDDEPIQLKPVKASGYRNFPIFGDGYSHTPLLSTKLKGQVFYVVGGHGGPDPGAIGTYGGHQLCEDEYAYDVALRLCRKLIQHGAVAYMITRDDNDGIRSGKILLCDKDETTWGNQKMFHRQKPRLTQRSNAINKLYEKHRKDGVKKQRMISIHIDSRGKRQSTDVFFYYYKQSKVGKKIARNMHKTLKNKYAIHRKSGNYKGTYSSRDLHMLRETKPASVYVELGNITNYNDQKRIVLESNREVLAKWLFEGMVGFRP